MSDQAYARLQKEAHHPSIGYWVLIIVIASAGIAASIFRIRSSGVTVEGVTFLIGGVVLWALIIARMIRDRKEKS